MGRKNMDANAENPQSASVGVGHAELRQQEMKPDHSVTGAGETSVSKATAEHDTDYGADGADLALDDITPEAANHPDPGSAKRTTDRKDFQASDDL